MHYDFDDFVSRMSKLGYMEILTFADAECARAERAGAKEQERGSVGYAERIKSFLWFMRFGKRPVSADDEEFARYRPVVVELVEKGQYEPEALIEFELLLRCSA